MNGIRLQIASEVENCSIQVSQNVGSSAEVNSLSDQCLADKLTIIDRESAFQLTENNALGENVAVKKPERNQFSQLLTMWENNVKL